jgi:hypothetical protein
MGLGPERISSSTMWNRRLCASEHMAALEPVHDARPEMPIRALKKACGEPTCMHLAPVPDRLRSPDSTLNHLEPSHCDEMIVI